MTTAESVSATLGLFQRYAGEIASRTALASLTNTELLREVEERLSQLSFLLQNIAQAEALVAQVVIVETTNAAGETEHYNARAEQDRYHFFVMRLLTESFYYFAFRVRQIFRNKVHPFPHLSSFDAPGVRDVRNHLIEHPEGKASRVFSQTFAYTPGTGMHLKTGRAEHEPSGFPDAGLRANADEFFGNLSDSLNRAITLLQEHRSK